MNFVAVTRDVELVGGADRSLHTLLAYLKDQHQIVLVAPRRGKLTKIVESWGMTVLITPLIMWTTPPGILRRPYKRVGRLLKAVHEARRLKHLLRPYNPEVIYTNNSMTAVGAITAALLHKPHIWHLREFPKEQFQHFYDLGNYLSNRIILNLSRKVICVSHTLSQYISSQPNQKIQVVYNGVVPLGTIKQATDCRADLSNRDTPLKIVYISNFSATKNQLEAVAGTKIARKQGANILLTFFGAGDTDYKQTIQAKIDQENLGGFISLNGYTSNPMAEYSAADLALVSSRWEGFGRVTAEAMCAKRMVLGANSGATAELIGENERGLLFKLGDPEDLARRIKQLDTDRDSIHQFSKRCHVFAAEHFTIERYTETMSNLILNAT